MKIKILFLTGFVVSTSLFSQNKTGIGNVSDDAGLLIPNAVVQISPVSDTSIVYEYICDKNGNYAFDIASADSVFTLSILPSAQTLQFIHTEGTITLSSGNNGILFHKVELTGTYGIKFTVVDTSGNPIPNAKVLLYDTQRKWRIDSCYLAKPVYTDANGQIEINSLLPMRYWFNIRKGYMTNRFTRKDTIIDTTGTITNITVPIRDLTQNEFYMCGLCDNKTWITDSIVIFGISQPYNADSKLLSDETWYDSNGNHGFWGFNNDETKMTYNYDSTSANGGGSTVDADLIELTDSSFVGNMLMFGIPTTYYMSAVYDTISLSLTAHDTTIYLDSSGISNITPDDLFINHNYCFTCSTTLSQSSFNTGNIGDNTVIVTTEDRCGNFAVDTIIVTVVPSVNAINEIVKSVLKIYPNPAHDFIVIQNLNFQYLQILDITGKIVKQFMPNDKSFKIRVSDLNQGIYFIRIYTAKDIITGKFIVTQ